MIDSMQTFAEQFPEWAQSFAIALLAAIPFVESYFGAVIGVLIGLPPALAIVAAVAGNVVSMIGFVYGADKLRQRKVDPDQQPTARQVRLRRAFDRWGVPGVSLLGQTMLPSQITAAAMVGFGATRKLVVMWQIVSIIVWGTLFGLFGVGILQLS